MRLNRFREVVDILLRLVHCLMVLLLITNPNVDGFEHHGDFLRLNIYASLDSVRFCFVEPLVDLVELTSHVDMLFGGYVLFVYRYQLLLSRINIGFQFILVLVNLLGGTICALHGCLQSV